MMNLAGIDVVVLCGGLGTRLRNIVTDRPKPMAEIGDRPFLDILLGYASSFGFRRFILCTGHMGSFIEEYYRTKGSAGTEVVISEEKQPLGTAGAIRNAKGLIKGRMFVALNGDSLCRLDMARFVRFHDERGAFATIALSPVENAKGYGVVTLGKEGRITAFNEKSSGGPGHVNAGVYVFDRALLDEIPEGRNISLEYDIFPKVLDKKLLGYVVDEKLFDIGTPERLKIARDTLS